MKKELHYYDIYPKVFMAKERVQITIKPLGAHVAFAENVNVSVLSMAHGDPKIYTERNNNIEYALKVDEDGCIRVSHVFPEESEYRIIIRQEGKVQR